MEQTLQEKLIHWICKLSYREGHFILSSGKQSSFYIDLKASTLHPEAAYWIAKASFEKLLQASYLIDGVGGLTLGADPLATGLSFVARENGLFWPAFIVRKEPKKHGTSRYIEGIENLPQGARVLVLEDVVTTGKSSLIALDRLLEAGYRPVAILTVVDREEGGAQAILQRGVPFLSLITLSDLREVQRLKKLSPKAQDR